MEEKDPLGILNKSENTNSDPLDILKGSEKKNSTTQLESPSDIGTSPSMDGASVPQGLPTVNPDLNAGKLQPTPEPLLRPNEPSITVAQPQGLSVTTTPSYATTKEVNQEGSSLSESALALQSGVATLGAIAARTPAYTSDFVNRAINTVNPLYDIAPSTRLNTDLAKQPNAIAENLEQIAKDANAESNKDYKDENGNIQGAYDLLAKGEIKKGLGKLANNVIEALPVSAGIVAASAAGVPTAGLIAGGSMAFGAQEKQNLLEKNEENKKAGLPAMSDEDINTVSLISGTLEGVTEAAFGNVKFASFYKDLVKKEGAETARAAIEPTVKEVLKKGFGRYLGNVSEEAVSEGANQYLDNLNHIIIGGDKEVKPWDNVMESALTGLGSALTIGAPTIPHTALQAARTRKQATEAQKHIDNQNALRETINNPLTVPETKEAAQEALSTSFKEEDKLKEQIQKEHADLPDNKKSEVNNHLESEHKALSASQDQNLTEEQRDAFKSDAEFHAKEVEEIYKENEKLIAEKEKAKEKEVQSFEKQGLPTEEHNPEDYKKDNDDILNSAKEEVKTIKKQEEDAIKEREVEQSNKFEHQNRNESGKTAETSSSNSDEQSGEKQQKEVISNVKKSDAPTISEVTRTLPQKGKEGISIENGKKQPYGPNLDEDLGDVEGYKYIVSRNKEGKVNGAIEISYFNDESGNLEKTPQNLKVVVDEKSRRKGIATKLFNHAEDNGIKLSKIRGKNLTQEGADLYNNIIFKNKKSEYIHKDELLDEEELSPEINPEKQLTDKLDLDLEVFKKVEPKNITKKYTAVNARIDKMVADKQLGKRTANAYKKAFNDMYEQKIRNIKEGITKVGEDIKKDLLGSYKGKIFSSTLPVTSQMIADLVDLGVKLTHVYIDGKFSTEEAIQKAVAKLKEHPLFKKLSASKSLNPQAFEKELTDKFINAKEAEGDNRQQTGKKEEKVTRKSIRSLSTNLYEGENLSDKVKEIIKKNGLDRNVYSHEEAKTEARKLIDEVGINSALSVAKDKNSDITGNLRMFVFGHILNDFHKAEMKASTTEEKDRLASMQADLSLDMEDLVIEMERQSTEAGRLIGSIGAFYQMSPLGIKKKLTKEINRFNDKKKKRMKDTTKKFKELTSQLNKVDKEYESKSISEPIEKKISNKEKLQEIRQRRSDLFTKLKGTFNNLGFAATPENVSKLQKEQLDIIFDIAKTYFESGTIRTKNLFKKLNRDLKAETGYELSAEDQEYILNRDINGRKFSDIIADKEMPLLEKEKRQKQIKIIEKSLAKREIKKSIPKKEYEKLLHVYEQDVIGTQFENAFYEKFGLTNVDKTEVKEKLDEFSKKIHNAPEGVLKNNETIKYLDWLSKYRKEGYISNGLISYWYADILSSYETHLRNMQFNGWTSLVNMPMLLAQKAITKGNFKDVAKYYGDFFSSLGDSFRESKAMVKTGQASRFEDVSPSNVLENSPYTKIFTYPQRFLRAEDALTTLPLYNMKQREIFSRVVDAKSKEDGVKLDNEKRQKAIDDLLGNSKERIDAAKQQSENEIEKIYGEKWKENKEAVDYQLIRQSEIIDKSRPVEVRDEARAWAKKALLTNKPEGYLGVVSDGVGHFLNFIPILRAVIPFINVPLNLVNQSIERSPLGFITVARGKIGWDKEIKGVNYGRKLTPDERKELRMKAVNYTTLLSLAITGVAMSGGFDDDDDKADFIVTGEEGGYFRNQSLQKGGGLEPYTVYIGGKNGYKFNYQNTTLNSLLSPIGYYRDYLKYDNDSKGEKVLMDGIIYSTFHYMNGVINQASMKGTKEFFKYMDSEERKRMADDGGSKLAKTLSTFFPYSGLIKATTKDVKGFIEADDKSAIGFVDYLTNGMPFDYYQNDKIDILGRPIKSQFDIPMFPYTKKNFSNDGEPIDKYYKLFKDKNYDPSTKFIKSKNAYTDKLGEFIMSKQQLYELNKTRGEIAQEILQQPRKGKGTLESELEAMSEDKFAETMDKVLNRAKEMAMIKTFVFDGDLPNKKLKTIYRNYKKQIQKDKSKEKPIEVL